MKNPWIRKNPFLSMWLSGANAVAGSVRGKATAYARKQAASAMTQGTKAVTDFWMDALLPPKPGKRKKRRS
jgi:hypothetical protein